MLTLADTAVLEARKDERCPPEGGRYINPDRTGKSACAARDHGAFMVRRQACRSQRYPQVARRENHRRATEIQTMRLMVCGSEGDAAKDFASRRGPNRREMAQSAGRQGRGREQIGDLDELIGVGTLIAIGAKG